MKTLQVSNGDIQLDTGGRLKFVLGSNKLTQEIALCLIGGPITPGSTSQIQVEIQRVLSLYRAQQIQALQSLQQVSQLSYYNKSEIIQSVGNISIYQGTGFIGVNVTITTLSNSILALNLLLTPNGIQVNNG